MSVPFSLVGNVDYDTIKKTFKLSLTIDSIGTLDEAKQIGQILAKQFADHMIANGGSIVNTWSTDPSTPALKPSLIVPSVISQEEMREKLAEFQESRR